MIVTRNNHAGKHGSNSTICSKEGSLCDSRYRSQQAQLKQSNCTLSKLEHDDPEKFIDKPYPPVMQDIGLGCASLHSADPHQVSLPG